MQFPLFCRALKALACCNRMNLTLYQRDDCHLCDLALDVLAHAGVPEFSFVFIDGDAELEAAYGLRVPVLRDADSGAELGWPFDADGVRVWLPFDEVSMKYPG